MKLNQRLILSLSFLLFCFSIQSAAIDPESYYNMIDSQRYELSAQFFANEEEMASYERLPENVKLFLHYERLMNDRVNHEDFEPITPDAVPLGFRPETNALFKVWSVEIPYSDLEFYYSEPVQTSKLPRGFIKIRDGQIFLTFIVHPLSYLFYKDIFKKYEWKLEYLAAPTSSHRSLIVWKPETPEDPVYVKVSLFLNIGGFTRLLNKTDILKATSNTTIINSIGEQNKQKLNFDNFSEMVSVFPIGAEGGMIIRDINPIKENIMLPLFSVYSKNHNIKDSLNGKSTILASIIEDSKKSAKTYISKKIISPLVELALYFYFRLGVTSHLHEQNVLLSLNPNEEPKMWIRDNEQFYMDIAGYMRYAETQSKDPGFTFKKPVQNIQFFKDTENPIDEMLTYIKNSNLYALLNGVSVDYPEITLKWIDREFERILIEKSKKYLPGNYKTLTGLKRAIIKENKKWSFLREQIELIEMECQDMFLIY